MKNRSRIGRLALVVLALSAAWAPAATLASPGRWESAEPVALATPELPAAKAVAPAPTVEES